MKYNNNEKHIAARNKKAKEAQKMKCIIRKNNGFYDYNQSVEVIYTVLCSTQPPPRTPVCQRCGKNNQNSSWRYPKSVCRYMRICRCIYGWVNK